MICYLVRHGKDDDTLRGGWSQHSLTDEGNAQAKELASFVQRSDLKIKHIYSSDLPRAVQTAQPVADQLHLPIMQMPGFREVNNGDLAGMNNELANRIYPGLYWNTPGWEEPYPGGESPRAFYERIRAAWDAFQKMILEQNGDIMLVTHGGVIQVILTIVNHQTYSNREAMRKIRNTEMIALEYQENGWSELVKGDRT